MFLIIDNTHRKIRNTLFSKLYALDLPVLLSDLEHADLYMPAALIIVTEKYLLKEAEYISAMYGNSPVVLWEDNCDFLSFAFDKYKEFTGCEITENLSYDLNLRGRTLYSGERCVKLSRTEKRILCYLIYNQGWNHKDIVAKYCMKNGIKDISSLPVHISNLNNKIKRITGRKFISSKRYVGYCIEERNRSRRFEIIFA